MSWPLGPTINIVRDPYVVFPSTVNLWRTLYQTHGLQTPTYAGLEERVLATCSGHANWLEWQDPAGAVRAMLQRSVWIPDLAALAMLRPILPPGWTAVSLLSSIPPIARRMAVVNPPGAEADAPDPVHRTGRVFPAGRACAT